MIKQLLVIFIGLTGFALSHNERIYRPPGLPNWGGYNSANYGDHRWEHYNYPSAYNDYGRYAGFDGYGITNNLRGSYNDEPFEHQHYTGAGYGDPSYYY